MYICMMYLDVDINYSCSFEEKILIEYLYLCLSSYLDRFIICYPWHMRFIRSLQVDSIDEDWLDKMQALAEKITQDDVNYPDIVCVFQSSLLHVAGAGYDRNNHSFIIKKRVPSP